jgi:uncharacterized integral membrane protein (TIGR00698 family)
LVTRSISYAPAAGGTPTTADGTRTAADRRLLPGLAIAVGVGSVAVGTGRLLPVVGAPVVAIVLGALVGPVARTAGWPVAAGSRVAARYVLQAAIVAFGTGLSLTSVLRVGLSSLPVMLGTLAACAGMAWIAGRLLGVDADLRVLIGAGTGVCGASAIGAVAPVIVASEAAVGYAMSTIFVFNVAAVLVFPAVGHLLGLGAHSFGLWAGTAINDTSSVTAAAYTYGRAAGDYAIVVKLCRALMIVPLVLGIALLRPDRRQPQSSQPQPSSPASLSPASSSESARPPIRRLVPAFLPLFLAAALANSVGAVPHAAHPLLGFAATLGVAVAMAGVGLGIRPADLRRAGVRPLVFGLVLSLTVAVTGLGLQALAGP